MESNIYLTALLLAFIAYEVDASISLASRSLSCCWNEDGLNQVIRADDVNRIVGASGKAGPAGEIGPAGSRGPEGEKGSTGSRGLKGESGPTGSQGPKGGIGPNGSQGPKGEKGSTGSRGLKGERGPTGSQGPKGEKGSTGSRGLKGESGPTGSQGPKGERGPTGLRGPKGERGPIGSQGPKGECNSNSYQQLVNEMEKLKEANEELRSSTFPKNCNEAKKTISTSGVNVIYPFGSDSKGIHVYCNQDIDDGGWIVIQRRIGGPVDFLRGWDEYVTGFGNKEADFWLGLEDIHLLTASGSYDLRIDLEDKAGNKVFAKYKFFKLGGADENYKLYVGQYSGNAGDGLHYHNQMAFSTKDKDNDKSNSNCAATYTGAWWYKDCHLSNLNGDYDGAAFATAVCWQPWKGTYENLKTAEMKIR